MRPLTGTFCLPIPPTAGSPRAREGVCWLCVPGSPSGRFKGLSVVRREPPSRSSHCHWPIATHNQGADASTTAFSSSSLPGHARGTVCAPPRPCGDRASTAPTVSGFIHHWLCRKRERAGRAQSLGHRGSRLHGPGHTTQSPAPPSSCLHNGLLCGSGTVSTAACRCLAPVSSGRFSRGLRCGRSGFAWSPPIS